MKKRFGFLVVAAVLACVCAGSPAYAEDEDDGDFGLADLAGVWVQISGNELVARKLIYEERGEMRMRYLWLKPGYVGGDYTELEVDEDGDIVFTERYKTHNTRHLLRVSAYFRMAGVQSGDNSVSEYLLLREE